MPSMKLGSLLQFPRRSDSPTANQECAKPEMDSLNGDAELAKRRSEVVEWLKSLFLDFSADEEDLLARLLDGTIFCRILERFRLPGSEEIGNGKFISSEKRADNISLFLSAIDQMGLPGFKISDLEQGPMTAVVYCLWSLKNHLSCDLGEEDSNSPAKFVPVTIGSAIGRSKRIEIRMSKDSKLSREGSHHSGQSSLGSGVDRRNTFAALRFKHLLRDSPIFSEPSTPHSHRSGHMFHEIFQLRQGRYSELPAAKISEMLKSNSLDKAPTQSLLSVIHEILEESIEQENGEIPYAIACLLRKVIREIERRISTQAEHIRNQNNYIKIHEDKYQSRIRDLETLANASSEETQMIIYQIQQLKLEKSMIEDKEKNFGEELGRLIKEKENVDKIILELKQTLETTKSSYEEQLQHQETNARESQMELKQKLKEAESFLSGSEKRRKEIEEVSKSRYLNWSKKEHVFQCFIDSHLQSVQDLRLSYASIKHEVLDAEKSWVEEFTKLGDKMKVLTDTTTNYHSVLAENRKLYNEVLELKGNIRVYCRIKPFLTGENKKQTTIENIDENGQLLLVKPNKQGKHGQRMFSFNKVFGPSATQEEVFLDIQPLIRSVLDGYNVCIFAYGQTGSGKTYTMTGPNAATEKDWGVNYRALNDLFHISRARRDTFMYEVNVQIVEIYNEQVRDLLQNHGTQKRLGIMTSSQPNGLAVPDASIVPVQSTSDVLELLKIGLANRVVSATALNERSSRSHSIVTVHVRGMDINSGDSSCGSLHLVDLAGSERVDQAEVIGDRLKEAQHINKSLSALGDVIFALSQKSIHVPYRNSKLTQILQSSLGGHAKTFMFVHINQDAGCYSETLSTLKFAERVSGVELGAARSQKEGKEVKDLMEQVLSLKDTIARKDEEIEQLKQMKEFRLVSPGLKMGKHNKSLLRHNSSFIAGISNLGTTLQHKRRVLTAKLLKNSKAVTHHENLENRYHSESSPQKFAEDDKSYTETFTPTTEGSADQSSPDVELLGIGDEVAEERLSDISDSVLSMGTETDGSLGSIVEFGLFPEQKKPAETPKEKMAKVPEKNPKPAEKKSGQGKVSQPKTKDGLKLSSSRTIISQTSMPSSARRSKRWQ